MKISTKKGDNGKTDLYSMGRVYKDNIRIEICGSVDELISSFCVVSSFSKNDKLKFLLREIQKVLSVICTNIVDCSKKDIEKLEKEITNLEEILPKLTDFVFPQETQVAALLFLSRAICRRAERKLVSYLKKEKQAFLSLQYLNRLSDLLFLLARKEN